MQTQCIYCKLEHYALNVQAVSHGDSACHNCGRVPPVFYDWLAYRLALKGD